MKKIIMITGIVFFITVANAAPASKPKLTSPILRFLDNKPYCLDCTAMGDILHVRREVRKIQFGVQDVKAKKFIGFYEFEGELRTLRWLADYERALTKEYLEQKNNIEKKYLNISAFTTEWGSIQNNITKECDKKIQERCEYIKRTFFDEDECDYQLIKMKREITVEHEQLLASKEDEAKLKHVKDKNKYQQELHTITHAYQTKMNALAPCLKAAIQDFITATAQFVLKLQGTKQMTLKLVEEFCLKYQRPYSFLLVLVEIEDDQIVAMFEKKMANCQLLDKASADLTDFLEALYYSCDKARTEFETREKAKK